MTVTIALPETIWDELLRSIDDPRESAAVLLAGVAEQDESLSLLVNEVAWVPDSRLVHDTARVVPPQIAHSHLGRDPLG